jgi:RNA polymerase sigma factor (sigma-70 family)
MAADQVPELFAKWHKPVRTWLRKRCGATAVDLDDLAQEVFIRMLRYPNAQITNAPSYIFKIAANVVGEWRVLHRVNKPHDSEWLEALPCSHLQAVDEQEICDRNARLYEAIAQLPERRRTILLMHAVEELTYKEIAVKLGLTYRIVLRNLTLSYTFLREKLIPISGDLL